LDLSNFKRPPNIDFNTKCQTKGSEASRLDQRAGIEPCGVEPGPVRAGRAGPGALANHPRTQGGAHWGCGAPVHTHFFPFYQFVNQE
jgi:hypothetical protein